MGKICTYQKVELNTSDFRKNVTLKFFVGVNFLSAAVGTQWHLTRIQPPDMAFIGVTYVVVECHKTSLLIVVRYYLDLSTTALHTSNLPTVNGLQKAITTYFCRPFTRQRFVSQSNRDRKQNISVETLRFYPDLFLAFAAGNTNELPVVIEPHDVCRSFPPSVLPSHILLRTWHRYNSRCSQHTQGFRLHFLSKF